MGVKAASIAITKQLKSRHLCLHQHILLCVGQDTKSPESASSTNDNVCTDTACDPSVSRINTVELMSQYSIPYSIPSWIQKCRQIDCGENEWPTVFEPLDTVCRLCGDFLYASRNKPGSSEDDLHYLMTNIQPFRVVTIKVKFCRQVSCKAMHCVQLFEMGLFNVNDKIRLACNRSFDGVERIV